MGFRKRVVGPRAGVVAHGDGAADAGKALARDRHVVMALDLAAKLDQAALVGVLLGGGLLPQAVLLPMKTFSSAAGRLEEGGRRRAGPRQAPLDRASPRDRGP